MTLKSINVFKIIKHHWVASGLFENDNLEIIFKKEKGISEFDAYKRFISENNICVNHKTRLQRSNGNTSYTF